MNLKLLQKSMKSKNIDAIILLNIQNKDPNLYYLSHIESEYTFLLIQNNKKPVIYTSSLEFEKTKQLSLIKNIKLLNKNPFEILNNEIKKHKHKKIGINFNTITLKENKILKKYIKNVKFIDINSLFIEIRKNKTNEEIKLIQKACSIGDNIFKLLIKNFKSFKTEINIANFIESEAKKQNCTLSFPVIVGSGKNGALPHYEPRNVPLNKGFCVLDFGVRYKGYCSDMTRTIYIGKPKEQEIKHYKLILDAIYESRKLIKHNIQTKKLDQYVHKKFGKLSKYYIHSLGHGLGTEVHESPGLSIKSKDKLQNNNVFTIEPGLYFPNKYGIRIEDDYVLKNNKLIQLTSSTHNLQILNNNN